MPTQTIQRSTLPAADTRKLRDLSGIGRSIERNLNELGIQNIQQLAASEGDELYQQLCEHTRTRQDPCILDTFRCAVAQARDPQLPAEKKNWWWWSRQRKGQLLPQ